jgi:carbonic anhydrase
MPLSKLAEGVHRFRQRTFERHRELFDRLAVGQDPKVLFITCSDSRIDPNLITHTKPGDLFVVRNAGNIVPAWAGAAASAVGGEAASIEFAIDALGVTDIVVCGHSHCGAMKGLLHPEKVASLPAVAAWLGQAEASRRIVRAKYSDLDGEELLEALIEENVLVQLENLETHPAVAAGLAAGKIRLHAWVYEIESGEVFAYDMQSSSFTALAPHQPPAGPIPARLLDRTSGDAKLA